MSCKKCIDRKCQCNLNTGDMYQGMTCIAVEDLITLVCTEFIKQNKQYLYEYEDMGESETNGSLRIPYLKMNYKVRRKLSEKLLEKMEQEYKNG